MDFAVKQENLMVLYDSFESAAAQFKEGAICKAGCAFCCTRAGSIDITTLEGLMLETRLGQLTKWLQKQVHKNITRNLKDQEKGRGGRCPFLRTNDTCMIYDARPFSCRRLYSLRPCEDQGPTLHRQVMTLAKETISEIKKLDDNGYSGHISFILHMLSIPEFRQTYLNGGFNPSGIMVFGKTHHIAINRYAAGEPSR